MSTRTKLRNGFYNRFREAFRMQQAGRSRKQEAGVEPLEGRIAPAAVITVTLNDNNSGSVTPGGTINYTEVIQHGVGSDAAAINLQIANAIANADVVPGSLNISPLAFDDAFSAIGNTHLIVGNAGQFGISTPAKVIAGNLFANDLEFANDLGVQDTFTLLSFTQPTQSGGSVTVAADGSFVYLPAAGFTGTDTFTYTITDDGVGGVGALTTTATVTITVGEAVWYVDDNAAPGGTGRSNSPLQSLAPLHTGGALDSLDNANDTIFVYSGNYASNGTIALELGQKLIGQGTNLVVDGITLVTGAAASRPTLGGSSGTIITFGVNNEVRGLNVTNTNGGGITGNNVGTLLMSDFDVTVTGGTALNLTGNSATVTVTGSDNDLSATNGTALSVTNVPFSAAGMTFKSISASGGTNGIVLIGTGITGSLTVTGSGAVANSGGIIQNTTGDGIVLQNTKDVSFNRIRVVDTGRHGIFGSEVDGFRLTNSTIIGAGDADEENGIQFGQDNGALGPVTTVGVRGTVVIQDTLIENATQWGLRVYNNTELSPLNMTLQRLTVRNNVGTFGENAVSLRFEDGTANVLVDDSDFLNNDGGFSAQAIGNNGAVMNVTIQNSVFDENLSLPSAVNFTTGGNTTGRLRLHNNTISGDDAGTGSSTLIDLDASDTSTLHAIITNNTGFDTGLGGALEFQVNDNAQGRAEVRDNTFTLTGSNKIGMLFRARSVDQNNETGSLDLTLEGNTINNLNSAGGVAAGFEIDAGTSTLSHANTVRLNISTAQGAGGNVVNGTAVDGFTFDFIVRQRTGTTFQLQGYSGSASSDATIATFFDTHNSAGTHNPSGSDTLVGAGGTHTVNYTGGTVLMPVTPTLPPAALLFESGDEAVPTSPGGNDGTSPVVVDDGLLSQAELDLLVAEAKARWNASGLTAEQKALLDSITFEVSDLGGRTLGLSDGTHVTIDNDGAGAGWFVDNTPSEDSEFHSGALVSRLDALTAVMHEMGHALGLDDTYDSTDSNSVMYGFLTFNTRRAPVTGEAVGATPHAHGGAEYIFSPINTAVNGAGVSGPITLPLGKTLTLKFAATVPTSTVATSVTAQGIITHAGGTVVSNDPTTVAANDATVTPIDLPDVSVALSSGTSVTEDAAGNLVYTFTRQGATDFARTITFNVGGTAAFGTDYTQSGADSFNGTTGTVTFGVGQSTVTVTITPTADNAVEPNETAVLTVAPGSGYDVGTPNTATGTIVNDDTEVKVELLSGTTVREDGVPNLVYTFTRTGVTTGSVTTNFSLTGSPTLTSSDYAILAAAGITFNAADGTGTVTFNAGETTKAITLDPTADNTVEADENAVVTVLPGTGYNVAGSAATGTILNDDAEITVSVSPSSVNEDGVQVLTYTFTRTGFTTDPLRVDFNVGGTATQSSGDYSVSFTGGASGFNPATGAAFLTFAAGATTATFTVDPTADTTSEPNETVSVTLVSGTGYTALTTDPVVGTILNDDTLVTLGVLPQSVTENGSTTLVYTFTRTGSINDPDTTVNFSVGGTATLGSDYTQVGANIVGNTGTVVIPSGSLTATVTITILDDSVVEGDETIALSVQSGTGYGVGTATPVVGTIVNDDTEVKVELLSGTSVREDGSTNLVYTFTRTGVTTGPLTANFSITGSPTLTSSDYAILTAAGITFDSVSGTGTVTFNQGEQTKTVTLDPTADTTVEGDENATVTVLAGTGYNVAGSAATGTILNDDANITVTVSPSSVNEDGSQVLTYTFTRTGFTADPLRVDFNVGGTATQSSGDYTVSFTGGANDFNPATGAAFLTFAAGSSTATFTVDPTADALVEPDETVSVTLVSGTGYTALTTDPVVGSILADDTIITLDVSPISVVENGSTTLIYTFTRQGLTDVARTINFSVGGTATFGTDYTQSGAASFTATEGTVTFGVGESTVTVILTPTADSVVELDETAVLTVAAGAGYNIGTPAAATGTIVNDDTDVKVELLAGTSVNEDGASNLVYTFTRTGVTTGTLTTNFSITGSPTLTSSDYAILAAAGITFDGTSGTGTVTFGAGETTKTITLDPTADNAGESDENAVVTVLPGTGYNVVGSAATGTIVNDDANITVTVSPGAVTEDGVQVLTYTFTREGLTTGSLRVDFNVGGTATQASGDYSVSFTGGASGFNSATGAAFVTFAPGETTATFTVDPASDATAESDETVSVTLVPGTGYTALTTDPVVGSIVNDDTIVTLGVTPASVIENGATTTLVYTFTRTGDINDPDTTVNFTVGGTATLGSDYTQVGANIVGNAGTVLIPSGSLSATVTITVLNDSFVEGDETIALSVLPGSGYGVGTAVPVVGTITDNDTAAIRLVSNTSSALEGAGTLNVGVELVITADGVPNTGSLQREVSVNLSDLLTGTANGSGVATDYTFTSPQVVTFASGAINSTQNVAVTLVNDARVEGNETIALQLGGLSDGTSGQVTLSGSANHTVTITDNDTATIRLVNNTSSALEGAGTHNVGVELVITADGTGTASLEREVSVNLSDLLSGTANGSGVANDYTFTSPQTVTFASGATNSTQNVSVTLVNDARVEGNETIALQLGGLSDGTSGQVTLSGSANHTVTITDNDTATVSLVSNTSGMEELDQQHNIGVQLVITADGTGTPSLERAVSVNLSDLLTGTANASGPANDYIYTSPQVVTFASGAINSTQNVSVVFVNDGRLEGDETINLQLGSLADGTGGQVSLSGSVNHTVTIGDNETATVSLANNASSALEEAGTHNVGVQLVIVVNGTGTGTLERELSVNLVDQQTGTATVGAANDYVYTSPQVVTFAIGSTSTVQNVSVGLFNDARVEGNETIVFGLDGLTNMGGRVMYSGSANHTVTITDNDTATISFSAAGGLVSETAGSGLVGVQLVINANGTGTPTLERPVSVNVADLLTGTASGAGVDYTFTSPQTVTFASGETASVKTVAFTLANDQISEGQESINFQLNTLADGTNSQVVLGQQQGYTVAIVDNDVDLRVTMTESLAPVVAGSGLGNLTYVIKVTNVGQSNATGVILSENLTLPAGVTIQSITPSVGSYNVTTTPDGEWVLGDLAASAEATLTVVLTVDATAAEGANLISNTASLVATDQVSINPVDDVATQSTSIDRQVDLQITKDDSVTIITPNGGLAYVLNVKNAGASNATGVVITETLPAGTTFNAVASSPGWTETASGSGIYTYTVGTVAGNSSAAPVTFAVSVTTPATAGQATIVNTATVSDDASAGADLTPADNAVQDTDTLNASPQFSLTITDDIAGSVVRGGLVRYTFTYANIGSQDASGVYLLENLPANATFDVANSSANWELQEDGTYRYNIGNLSAGAAPQSVIFAVRVDSTIPAGVRELVNTGSIDDDGTNSSEDLKVSDTEATLHYQGIYVVSPGITLPKKGAPATVRVFDIATGAESFSFLAYEANYRDSVRVAVGDINGDGYDDIITAERRSTGKVRVFDGLTGERFTGTFAEINPFNGRSERGAYVESGDVTGDGRDDIIVGSALGGGKVKIYDGVTGSLVNEYNAFSRSYRGGVRLAVADVNGDGTEDVIAGQGNYGNVARVFDADSSTQLHQIQVGGRSYRGGISVAAGDVNGDGKADIITGRNSNSAPLVEIFSGADLSSLGRFLAFEAKFRNGIRVAAADVNVDGIADIIVGAGFKGNSRVKIFDGDIETGFEEIRSFVAFPEYPMVSLFVAGSNQLSNIVAQV